MAEDKWKFFMTLEIDHDELEAIFKELEEAKEQIRRCYNRLNNLGVLTYKSNAAISAGNTDNGEGTN